MSPFLPLSEQVSRKIIARILIDYGKGVLSDGAYVFDAITRLPEGWAEERTTWMKMLPAIQQHKQICVVFDPHPNNTPYRHHLLRSICAEDVLGLVASPENVTSLLAATHCDFYITTIDGDLLAVASHEDEDDGGERVMWRPVRNEAS